MCLVYHTLFADETTPETSKRRSSLRSCHRQRNRRTSAVCYCYDPRHDHRHHDRCERALFPEESADGHYHRRGPHDELRSRAPRSNAKKGQSLELNFEITENGITMDDVVVSASRSETTRRKAPALVNVLDRKIFDNTNSACLAQGLGFQPGVRVEDDCQNCGFMQVRINGLDGHYSQILVDSHPVFSALSGVYGLEQIPASMIDRVEVMRGGGSALFGSSAIGGTINIITKDPRPQQRRSRSHDHGDRQQQQLRQRHLGQCLARHRQP